MKQGYSCYTRLPRVLLFFFLLMAASGNLLAQQEQVPVKIPRYEMLELSFQAQVTVDNPFTQYLLKVRLTAPDGSTRVIDGFFDGDGNGGQSGNIWKVRICPDQPGIWYWQLVAGDIEDSSLIGKKGSFDCGRCLTNCGRGSSGDS